MTHRDADVIVVGAGAAGCALAARLARDPSRLVLVLEAGAAGSATRADLLDAGSIRGAEPGHSANWSYPASLTPSRPYSIARGRAMGGSTATNGGYFQRATRADVRSWERFGGAAWSWPAVVAGYRDLEADADFGDRLEHGEAGPVPVRRSGGDDPITRAVLAAASELGIPFEHDKNGDEVPGAGLVPMNVVEGVRVSAAASLLASAQASGVVVHGGTIVDRVRIEAGAVTGVEAVVDGGRVAFTAPTVVLCAGNLASPPILLRSGIGPRAALEALGIAVVVDAPGVGEGLSDHPQVAVRWRARAGVIDLDAPTIMAASVSLSSGTGRGADDVELLPLLKPTGYLLDGTTHENVLDVLVSLERPLSRGSVRLRSADPLVPPAIEYGYLEQHEDVVAMRSAVRSAVALLETAAFAGIRTGPLVPDARTVDVDDALDEWIAGNLGTSLHGCGGASFAPTGAAGPVVDPAGRVRGVTGLRVADTSILPSAPSRGPAATAVLIGDAIGRAMLVDE